MCNYRRKKKLQFPCESCIMPFLFIRRECGCLETNVPLLTPRSHKRDCTVCKQAGGRERGGGAGGVPGPPRCQRLMDATSKKCSGKEENSQTGRRRGGNKKKQRQSFCDYGGFKVRLVSADLVRCSAGSQEIQTLFFQEKKSIRVWR